MRRKHLGWRAAVGGNVLRKILGRLFENAHRAARGSSKISRAVDRDPAFEHGDVVAGILAREGQIGAARRLERGKCGGLALVVGVIEKVGEHLIALPGSFGDEILAAFKMTVDSGGGDARLARGLGQRKSGRALFGDQRKAGVDERLAQVAVVIAALEHSQWSLAACVTISGPPMIFGSSAPIAADDFRS